MSLDHTQRRILELLARGPAGDRAIADEIGDDDTLPHVAELQRAGLVEQSEHLPDQWLVTEDGRRALDAGL